MTKFKKTIFPDVCFDLLSIFSYLLSIFAGKLYLEFHPDLVGLIKSDPPHRNAFRLTNVNDLSS